MSAAQVGTRGTGTPITLRTLAAATAQDVFTQVARHLLTQLATSYGRGAYACAYRGTYGMRCAAGCLIGDDEYRADLMEGVPWSRLVREGIAPMRHEGLIPALQEIHDEHDPGSWHDLLTNLARTLGLQMPEVKR